MSFVPFDPWYLRLARWLAGRWDSLEVHFRGAERRTRRIEAEVRQLGLDLLDRVDDLPGMPPLVVMPPLTNQFYGHGAFMGAAPGLLQDQAWRRILAFLMPDVFLEVKAACDAEAQPGTLIPMFENNPVMCAYGAWHGAHRREGRDGFHPNDLAGVEWDVFIDSLLVEAWEVAGDDAARRALVARMADTMVIAHASTADTVQEAAGVCQYEDVRRTSKTRMGGVQPDAWLDLFGRALRLAGAPDLRAAIEVMAREPRVESVGGVPVETCRLHTFAHPASPEEALVPWRALTGRPRFSIVLEMKSRKSTSALLGGLVEELNHRGLHVVAVCSFDPAEVEGVGRVVQRVGGAVLPGPREIRFFHWAGDLQEACDRGTVARGQALLFNGASLLERVPDAAAAGTPPYAWRREVIEELEDYRQEHDLSVGVYVQEGDCDNAAAEALAGLVHRYPATFELGFAWGGLLDEVHVCHDGTDRRGFGSQAMLKWVNSRPWRTRGDVGAAPEPSAREHAAEAEHPSS